MISELLRAYILQGWFFVFGHVCLLAAYVVQLRRFSREATALQAWYSGSAGTTQCTKALNDFVGEAEKWAAQGSLVPLTDFTDRLDSAVDGMIGRLHDLVNLFLVVGIAGTVYGMFYFVIGVRSSVPVPPDQLALLLSAALGKALPVAFMGLLFYVGGYVVASRPEQKLRDALGDATRRALHTRKVPPTKALATSIQEALQPLKELQATLTGVVQPVIERWGQHLDETYTLVGIQLAALNKAVNSVSGAVDGVGASVHELNGVAQELRKAVQSARPVLEKMDVLYEAQAKRLEELSETITQTRQAASTGLEEIRAANSLIQQTMKGFEGLPGQTRELVEQQMRLLSEQLPGIWGGATDQLRQNVVNIVTRVETPLNAAADKIGVAADEWKLVAVTARGVFDDVMNRAVEKVQTVARQELRNLEDVFANRFRRAVDDLGKTVNEWETLSARMQSLSQELTKLLTEVRAVQLPAETVAKLEAIRSGIGQCADGIARTQDVLRDGGRSVAVLVRDIDKQMMDLLRRRWWDVLFAPMSVKRFWKG